MLRSSVFAATVSLAAAAAYAAPVDPNLPGNTSYDGWADMTSGAYPGYGGFPGSSDWPAPIASNQSGSDDAAFDKLAGNGFPAGGSVYVGAFASVNNTAVGTFAVTDSTALTDLANVVFQIQIGEANGYDFAPNVGLPVLSFNGGDQSLSGVQTLVSRFQDGTFTDPETEVEEPVFINTWAFQWDLSGIGEAITSFDIEWSAVGHSQIYALQLDQSDVYNVIPEPASLALFGMGGLMMMRRRRGMPA